MSLQNDALVGKRRADRRTLLVLVLSCVASYVIVADVAMVNVALPSIADGARLTPTGVHWFVTTYALAFSALPSLAGRVSDRFGHVRVFAGAGADELPVDLRHRSETHETHMQNAPATATTSNGSRSSFPDPRSS